MPWPPRRSSAHELELQKEVTTLQLKLLRTNAALKLKQTYAERLEHLLSARNARIDELTGTIDQLRQRNHKLNLENHCLTALLTAPPVDATMLAPK
jgi:chromosome segregation ATPase